MSEDLDAYLSRRRQERAQAEPDTAELARQLRAFNNAPEVIREPPARPFDPDAARRDWIHALRDATALRHGVPVSRPHPFAAGLLDMPIHKIARAIGVGLTTSDFSQILVDGYSLVLPTLNDQNPADLLVRDQFVSNYKTFTMGTIDYESPAQLFEETIPPFNKVEHQAVSGALLEYAITIRLSRELLVDDTGQNRGIIDEMIRQSVQLLARQDLILIASVLAANGNLGDGSPLFGAANSVTISGPTVAKLGEAVNAMTTQETGLNNKACATPTILMVSPDDAVEWAVCLQALWNALPLRLIINPYLATSSAYLMADPNKTTALVRLRMQGTRGPRLWPMSYLPGPSGERLTYNGSLISARYMTNIVPVSRLGVVKLST